jgi:cobalt-zinc-cadmium efflux system outer membrane protein
MQKVIDYCLSIKPTCARGFTWRDHWLNRAIVASILMYSLAAHAQDTLVPSSIQLTEAISRALAEHPELEIFAHRRAASELSVGQAGVAQRPKIGLVIEDAMGTGEHSNLGGAQTTLSIAWVLEQDSLDGRIRAAKSAATQVNFDLEIKALDVSAHTAKLFIQSLILEQRLQLAKLAEKQAKSAVVAISKRVQVGKSLVVDKLQSEAEWVRRQLETEDLEHELYASHYQLVAQWGGVAEDYSLSGDLLKVPQIDSLEKQLKKLKLHPALLAFANQQRIAQSEMELARIEARPKWQISAGIRRYETSDDFGMVAGISIPWGSDKRILSKVQILEAKQAEYQSEAKALSRRLNTQLFVLLQNINHSKHVIDTLTNQVIPLLEQAEEESSRAYDIGKLGYLQWTLVRQELLNTQAQLLDAYQDIHLQYIEIQRLTGASLSN